MGYGTDPTTTAYPTIGIGYGRGYQDVLKPGNPAAGAVASVTLPGNRFRRFYGLNATLATSVAVANRTVTITVKDGDGVPYWVAAAATAVAASQTVTVQGNYGLATAYTGGDASLMLPLPPMLIQDQWRIELGATNLQAADQFSSVHWWWEDIPIGGDGYPVGVVPAAPPSPLP